MAWYPGQAGSSAIADVHFGDYNPGGRLPLTFYRGEGDLPAFDNYSMAGRTYRFFSGAPLYPFGHGLSYTTFSYAVLRTSAESMRPSDTITVSASVTNTGTRAGDEVVQLYVEHLGSAVERPIKELKGDRRLTLMPGETQTVRFPVAVSTLAYWHEREDRWLVEATRVRLSVAASSADIRLGKTIRVTER